MSIIHQNLNDWRANGRIGNQFFKVASMTGIGLKNHTPYYLDTVWDYQKYFTIPLHSIRTKPNSYIRDPQPYYHYEEVTLDPDGIYGIEAYLQSEKYFEHCKEYIKEFFTLRSEYSDQLKSQYKDRLGRVALHVRRTDFVGNGCTPALSLEYYEDAITYFPQDDFLVFSDDIDWCRNQPQFSGSRFMFQERGVDIFDLFLLSYCKGIIMANSSYSWWGAWLGERDGYNIIAPKGWFGGWESGTLVPERWLRIGKKFWEDPSVI